MPPPSVQLAGAAELSAKVPLVTRSMVEATDDTVGPLVVTVGPELRSTIGLAATVIVMVSLSVLAPPEPVLPASLVSIVSEQAPADVEVKVGADKDKDADEVMKRLAQQKRCGVPKTGRTHCPTRGQNTVKSPIFAKCLIIRDLYMQLGGQRPFSQELVKRLCPPRHVPSSR